MSWLPVIILGVAAFIPAGWMWTGDTTDPGSTEALLIVVVMIGGGVLGALTLLSSFGSASATQLGVGVLMLLGYVAALGFFAINVGVANIMNAVFSRAT
jgi:hypothetical protein